MVQALAAEPGFEAPFSAEFPQLESLTTGEWWKKAGAEPKKAGKGGQPQILSMDVPRDEVVCFAYYANVRIWFQPNRMFIRTLQTM